METADVKPDLDRQADRPITDILTRVHDRGDRLVVGREGEALAVIQPATAPEGPTLHQLADVLADVPWPDRAFFDESVAIRAEMNVSVEPSAWFSPPLGRPGRRRHADRSRRPADRRDRPRPRPRRIHREHSGVPARARSCRGPTELAGLSRMSSIGRRSVGRLARRAVLTGRCGHLRSRRMV